MRCRDRLTLSAHVYPSAKAVIYAILQTGSKYVARGTGTH